MFPFQGPAIVGADSITGMSECILALADAIRYTSAFQAVTVKVFQVKKGLLPIRGNKKHKNRAASPKIAYII